MRKHIILTTLVVFLFSTAVVTANTAKPHGQPVGDALLIKIAESGNESVKSMTFLVRYSGKYASFGDNEGVLVWTASTDLFRTCHWGFPYIISCYPQLKASSKSRWQDNGYPADIQRIGLRSRVWKKLGNDWEQIYQNQVNKYDDSDAYISWSGESYGSGEYLARSNHWFETSSGEKWYPETSDTCNC